MRWAVATLLVFAAFGARAAEISSRSTSDKVVVTIQGDIAAGDYDKFQDVIGDQPKAVINLNSNGGDADEGMQIGSLVRKRHYTTSVLAGRICASACAMIWIGGEKRIMQDGARIGFHGVFHYDSAQQMQDARGGNAVVGAYYGRLGLSDEAIRVLTEADPRTIRWLTLDDAASLDIDVARMNASGAMVPYRKPKGSLPIDDATTEEKHLGERLAQQFRAQYVSSGMNGVNASITSCYDRARDITTFDATTYCASLDMVALFVEGTTADANHTAPDRRNTAGQTKLRTQAAAERAGKDGNTVRRAATRIALVAMKAMAESSVAKR